jgi:hypothetical protein
MVRRGATKKRFPKHSGIIDPEYLSQKRATSPEEARSRSITAKKNTGHFFAVLYQALEGGTVHPLSSRDVERLANGERRSFSPDVTFHKTKGVGYTEVKTTSTRSATAMCGALQVRNYSFKLVDRISRGDELPWVDYAFFRYGDWAVKGLEKLENGELTETLAGEPRDLLIAPINLVFFMLMNSPTNVMNQTSSDSPINQQTYWYVQSGMLRRFHRNPNEAIPEMIENGAFTFGLERELGLEHLVAKQYVSPDRYTPRGTLLRRFAITKYRFQESGRARNNYRAWLESFAENHGKILDALGISDTYCQVEDQVSPF